MILRIIDDDGFIAIVNAANYQSFVNNNWRFDELMAHFIDQMNAGNISIWQSSNDGGGNWFVSLSTQASKTPAFREFDQFINVISGELFLTNYSDLTMAAQFSNESIPAAHNSDLKIELKNGWHKLTVKQLFDPSNNLKHFDTKSEEYISFEIIFTPSHQLTPQKVNCVYWYSFQSYNLLL